jgi:AraC-like DNA-binding protein
VETLLGTPRSRLDKELGILGAETRLPAWCHEWATGDMGTAKRIGWAFKTFYRTLIEPYWKAVQLQFDEEVARRSNAFLGNGCEGLLEGISPAIRWRPPILEADYPVDYDLYLNGSGLLLVPAFFCWRAPVTLADSTLRPVLVYPMIQRSAVDAASMPSEPVERDTPMDDRRRRALFHRIQAFIERHLTDPALDPTMIAEVHHISVRTLHRMFECYGYTVAEHIRALRMERCRCDLEDPAFHGRPIHAIAARWGLLSPAHFTRLFRSFYGLGPQEYRTRHSRSVPNGRPSE